MLSSSLAGFRSLPSMTSRLQQKSFAESVISPLPLPPQDLATMHCRVREPAFWLYTEPLQYFGTHFISGRSPRFLSWATAASFRFLLCSGSALRCPISSLFRSKDSKGQFGHQIQSISRSSLAVMLSSHHFVTSSEELSRWQRCCRYFIIQPLFGIMLL